MLAVCARRILLRVLVKKARVRVETRMCARPTPLFVREKPSIVYCLAAGSGSRCGRDCMTGICPWPIFDGNVGHLLPEVRPAITQKVHPNKEQQKQGTRIDREEFRLRENPKTNDLPFTTSRFLLETSLISPPQCSQRG